MKTIFFSSVIVALFICSCATETETELTDEQKTAIQNEVNAEFEKMHNSIQQTNYDSYFELWSKNDFISKVSFEDILTDVDVYMDSVKVLFANRERNDSEIQDLLITPLSQDLVLLSVIVKVENWFKSGDSRKVLIVDDMLFKKEQEGWRIVHSCETGRPIEEEID